MHLQKNLSSRKKLFKQLQKIMILHKNYSWRHELTSYRQKTSIYDFSWTRVYENSAQF